MNDDLNAAVEDVVHIISTVRRRTMRHKKLIDQINATFSVSVGCKCTRYCPQQGASSLVS